MEKIEKKFQSIKTWSSGDRPREKMLQKGAASLSHAELLARLIHHGTRDRTALDLAKELLNLGRQNLDELGKLDKEGVVVVGEAHQQPLHPRIGAGRWSDGWFLCGDFLFGSTTNRLKSINDVRRR